MTTLANPYYETPPNHERVGEVELAEPDYSFDILLVLRDTQSGEFLWATDSGCSCPSPFESTSLDDFNRGDFFHMSAALNELADDYSRAGIVELIQRARSAW